MRPSRLAAGEPRGTYGIPADMTNPSCAGQHGVRRVRPGWTHPGGRRRDRRPSMLRACVIRPHAPDSRRRPGAAAGPTAPPQPAPDARTRLTDESSARSSAPTEMPAARRSAPRISRTESDVARCGACIEARNPDLKPLFAGARPSSRLRQLRDACRDELRSRNLRGPERRQAMRTARSAQARARQGLRLH